MAYKAFSENQINSRPLVERETVSLSKESPCASHVHFLTGVRSLGKLDIFSLTYFFVNKIMFVLIFHI